MAGSAPDRNGGGGRRFYFDSDRTVDLRSAYPGEGAAFAAAEEPIISYLRRGLSPFGPDSGLTIPSSRLPRSRAAGSQVLDACPRPGYS